MSVWPEVYLGLCQTSVMEYYYCKNSSIKDITQGLKYTSGVYDLWQDNSHQ